MVDFCLRKSTTKILHVMFYIMYYMQYPCNGARPYSAIQVTATLWHGDLGKITISSLPKYVDGFNLRCRESFRTVTNRELFDC